MVITLSVNEKATLGKRAETIVFFCVTFRFQVSEALRVSKPLFLHSRDAEEDFITVMTEFGFGANIKVTYTAIAFCEFLHRLFPICIFIIIKCAACSTWMRSLLHRHNRGTPKIPKLRILHRTHRIYYESG